MEADFVNHGAARPPALGQKAGLEIQLGDGEASNQGHRLLLSPEEIENTNFKILAAVSERQLSFIIPKEQPLELLFFRRIFTRLRAQKLLINQTTGRSMSKELSEGADEIIPIQAFQRVMGRLFYVLRDPQGFDSKVYDENGNNYVGWGEFCYVWKDRKITVRLSLAERIFLTLDDPQSSYLARIISVVTLLTIVASSLGFILSTVPEFQDRPSDNSAPKPGPVFDLIEHFCLIIFVLEYLARLGTCWAIRPEVFDKAALLELVTGYERIKLTTPVVRVIRFLLNVQNMIDLAAIAPGVATGLVYMFTGEMSDGGGGFVVLRLVRLTRIFRAFRLGKYVEPVIVIARTVKQSTKALYVLAFNLLLGVVIFGSLMFLMEQGDWDPKTHEYWRTTGFEWNATLNDYQKVIGITPFKSIPHAFWWALVTSTTVGYGDHYPTTSNGYIVAVVCMVWSLVILALPVGVIGGTFTQVWADFANNKMVEAEVLRREMVYVSHAVQRIEPAKVSRLLLLEVWNDDGLQDAMPASPEDFMGEVRLELDLPPDAEIRGREMRLRLQPNFQVVRKEITGFITVRYDWFPAEPGTHPLDHVDEAEDRDLPHLEKVLHGTLRLDIISGSDLVNTDWGRHLGQSSPYVMALCYPKSPALEAQLHPVVWRSPTAYNSLSPVWESRHSFQYLWYVPVDTRDNRSQNISRVGSRLTVVSSRECSARLGSCEDKRGGSSSLPQPFLPKAGPGSPVPDEVMSMLLQLTGSMPKLAANLAQIQQQVSSLSSRVDDLSASLQEPGRPSHDLRVLARGDAGNGYASQPGRQRKHSDSVSENSLDVALEEVMNAGVVHGGASALSIDMVATAASLPHTIPSGPAR